MLPEYDPYKYNSFPVNAANQIYTVTRTLRAELDDAQERGRLAAMPRVVMFQSVVDSTVTAGEVVRGLLNYLPPHGHELVVFDVNRYEQLEALVASGPLESLERLRAAPNLPFKITVIANRDASTRAVGAFVREEGEQEVSERDLPYEWPRGILSLGHVALPFPVDDPLYGLEGPPRGQSDPIQLGHVPGARRERRVGRAARAVRPSAEQPFLRRDSGHGARDAAGRRDASTASTAAAPP